MAMFLAVSLPAGAAGAQSSKWAPASPMTFDIPAQPLDRALETYGVATGWEVLYNSNFAVGRRSNSVRGSFTPEAALQAMLTGTGLVARYTDIKSFVLIPVPQETSSSSAVAALSASVPVRWTYYGLIQQSLREALCANDDAEPGRYRIAAQFWIGPAGNVVGYQRLGSTGNPQTDSHIDQRLSHLKIGAPPPANFAQPVTILVVPQAPDVTLSCDADRAGLLPAKVAP